MGESKEWFHVNGSTEEATTLKNRRSNRFIQEFLAH